MTHFTKRLRTAGLLISALAAATVIAACGSSSHSSSASPPSSAKPAPSAAHAGPATVSISNFSYSPARIVVTPGTKITFVNHDATAHTATTVKPGFDTGTIAPGKSATVSLRKPGTYPYMCQFHAFMHGVVIVRQ